LGWAKYFGIFFMLGAKKKKIAQREAQAFTII